MRQFILDRNKILVGGSTLREDSLFGISIGMELRAGMAELSAGVVG